MKILDYKKEILFFILLCGFIFSYFLFDFENGFSAELIDKKVKILLEDLGFAGPILIILLMSFAILVSPLPSAPIALLSGAFYGHTWGTLYVLMGSMLGACCAFFIARNLGFTIINRWFKGKLNQGLIGSQNTLMGIIFVSRLMPFISFDIISYAAGLTIIQFWRFFLATLLGITPASFLLAHYGAELKTLDEQTILITTLVMAIIISVPIIIYEWVKYKKIS